MDSIVTVDHLLKLLQGLHDYGYGNMRVKCKDNYLHEDEIVIDYSGNENGVERISIQFSGGGKG